MYDLMLKGEQKFMGKEIPVVYGGFGENQKCISDKTIAEIHGIKIFHVRETLSKHIRHFKESVDYIDLKVIVLNDNNLLENLGYTKMQVSKAEHIYILSERGYAKLIKIMDTDLAWEIHDKLIDEYFQLREEKEAGFSGLSPLLQTLINMELKQKEQDEKIEIIGEKVDNIKNVVALNPNDWRRESTNIVNKIASAMGGYEHIKAIREESYKLLNERYGVNLSARLINKRNRAAGNGMAKKMREKINYLDVIAEDKKLIEGYVSIIKEMAVKYDAANQKLINV